MAAGVVGKDRIDHIENLALMHAEVQFASAGHTDLSARIQQAEQAGCPEPSFRCEPLDMFDRRESDGGN